MTMKLPELGSLWTSRGFGVGIVLGYEHGKMGAFTWVNVCYFYKGRSVRDAWRETTFGGFERSSHDIMIWRRP